MKRLADAERSGEATLKTAAVASIVDVRKLPPDKLSGGRGRGQAARVGGGPADLSNWPIIDGWVIPHDQYKLYESRRYNDIPVLMGYNSDEGLSFSPPRTQRVLISGGCFPREAATAKFIHHRKGEPYDETMFFVDELDFVRHCTCVRG